MKFTNSLIASYERYALEREYSSTDEFKVRERSEFLRWLRDEQRCSILELGCGPGHDAKFFQAQGFRVFAIDNAPAMVKLAREKGVSARILDCYNLDQLSETFDAVYSMNCLLHVPQADIGEVFDLIAARLVEDGLMYVGVWGGDDFEGILERDSYEPKRFFSLRSAETLLKVLQKSFRLEYYRRLEPRDGICFHSVIARRRLRR